MRAPSKCRIDPPPGRHRVDRHHRRPHAHARDRGLERPLEPAGIQRDVGGGATHVEPDDLVQARHAGGAGRPDDAAGRSRQDGVLALEAVRLGQAAVRLHEIQPRARQFRRHLIHIAAQDRRQVGIHHRRVAAWHQPQQRADRMAGGHLGEPGLMPVPPDAARGRDISRRASARWRRR